MYKKLSCRRETALHGGLVVAESVRLGDDILSILRDQNAVLENAGPENVGLENAGPKMQGWKMQDRKMRD